MADDSEMTPERLAEIRANDIDAVSTLAGVCFVGFPLDTEDYQPFAEQGARDRHDLLALLDEAVGLLAEMTPRERRRWHSDDMGPGCLPERARLFLAKVKDSDAT